MYVVVPDHPELRDDLAYEAFLVAGKPFCLYVNGFTINRSDLRVVSYETERSMLLRARTEMARLTK